MEFNYKASKEENRVLRDRIKANEDNIFKFNQNTKELKDSFLLKLQDTYEKIFTQIENIQNTSNTADQQSKVNKAKINSMDAQIQSDRKQIDSHSTSLLKVESKIETVNQATVKEKKYKEEMEKIDDVIKSLQIKENDFINHLATIENYVEKYLPAQIQTQVGESLKESLPRKELKKFEDSQKKIFESLNRIILADDGVPDILSRIMQTRNLMHSGEIKNKGAMYSIMDQKMSPISRTEHPGMEDSPIGSDASKSRFSKIDSQGIAGQIEKPGTPLTKNESHYPNKNVNYQKKKSCFKEASLYYG